MDVEHHIIFASGKATEYFQRARPKFASLVACIGQNDKSAGVAQCLFCSGLVNGKIEGLSIYARGNVSRLHSAGSADSLTVPAHDDGEIYRTEKANQTGGQAILPSIAINRIVKRPNDSFPAHESHRNGIRYVAHSPRVSGGN